MRPFTEDLATQEFRLEVGRLIEAQAELKTLSHMLPEMKLFEWAHCLGVQRFPSLANLMPPVPPEALRERVAEPELGLFLWTGLADIHSILDTFERHAMRPLPERPAILSFGAGCGRTVRFLNGLSDRMDIHSIDVNEELVKWSAENLPHVKTHLGSVLPPLDFEDGAFSFIYSLSVFTHLNEEASDSWMQELARIMHPGGLFLVTTHGETAVARIATDERLQQIVGIVPDKLKDVVAELDEAGFSYFRYEIDRLDDAKAGEDYGVSFMYKDYLRQRWGHLFDIVEFRDGGMRGWQDSLLLRRRT